MKYLIVALLFFCFFLAWLDLDTVPYKDLPRAYLMIGIVSLIMPLFAALVINKETKVKNKEDRNV